MKLNNRFWSLTGLVLSLLLTMQATAETSYRVKSLDTVSRVTTKFYKNSSYSRAQIMVAILAKNPNAFRGGNINILLKGKRLTLPTKNEIKQISKVEAQQLLSQHARFFRNGITGGLTIPNLSTEANRNKTIAVVEKQTKKITQLTEESSSLKQQLENLSKQKKKRDLELVKLEKQIEQLSVKKVSAPKGSPEQIAEANNRLKETNEILQKKLIESKSELVENARSTMTLERKLGHLREKMDMGTDGTALNSDSSTQADNKQESSGSPTLSDSKDSSSLSDKYFWVLPLLLFVAILFLLWLLSRWFFGRSKRRVVKEDNIDYEKDYASLIEENESTDYLNPENNTQEENLEPSIKLDVARAYIESDDDESAINILEEIMQEGNDKQKKEAYKILEFIKNPEES